MKHIIALVSFKKAFDYYTQALEIAKKINNKPLEGLCYGHFGEVYYGLCDYQKAIDYYTQALEIAKKINDINLEN